MKVISILFSLAFFSLVSTFGIQSLRAQAGGPPMLTNDSGTPDPGTWENNFPFVFEGSKDIYTLEGPVVDINYGFNEKIQLTVEFPWVKEKGQPVANKLDNITFGAKYRFHEDSNGYSASTFPAAIISLNTPSADGRKVHYGFFLPLAIGKTFGPYGINGQVGYEWLAHTKHVVYGVDVSREFGESLVLLLELHGELEKIEEDDPFLNAGNFINLGAQIKLTEMFTLLTAVGKGLSPDEFGNPTYYAYCGLQLIM